MHVCITRNYIDKIIIFIIKLLIKLQPMVITLFSAHRCENQKVGTEPLISGSVFRTFNT